MGMFPQKGTFLCEKENLKNYVLEHIWVCEMSTNKSVAALRMLKNVRSSDLQ